MSEDDPTKGRAKRGRFRNRARGSTEEEEPQFGIRHEEHAPPPGSQSPVVGSMRTLRMTSDSPPSDEERRRYTQEGGNGNGNGGNGEDSRNLQAGPGARRVSRLPESAPNVDDELVNSRDGKDKFGKFGNPISLYANFFDVKRMESWCLYQYRVDFDPEVDSIAYKKFLLRQLGDTLPAYIFDGTMLFLASQLAQDLQQFVVENPRDQSRFRITLKFVGQLDRHDPQYLQFYNIMARKCLQMVGLTLVGRNYFNPDMKIELPNHGLEIWPGFLTTIRQHDRGLLYCVQGLHKVLRQESVLTFLSNKRSEARGGGNFQDAARAELVGVTVLTRYNNRTYRLDDIDWDGRPTQTFKCKGSEMTLVDYYKQKYDLDINPRQPLLISKPKQADLRRGQTADYKLIPELCVVTGLTDSMRQNFGLMKDMGQYLFQPPQKKANTITNFMKRVQQCEQVQHEFQRWGLEIGTKMVQVTGRQFPPEDVYFNDRNNTMQKVRANEQGDFTQAFRNFRMTSCVPMKTWVIVVPGREAQNVDNLIRTMQQVSRAMGFNIDQPVDVLKLQGIQIQEYMEVVRKVIQKYKSALQMVMTILPNNKLELYSAIKKLCYVDYGVSSQCFLAKNLTSRGLMSIATKLTVQMNCKMGGEAWQGVIPLKKMMIVGFDVHHGAPGSNSESVGAMVATITDSYGRYYSTVTTNLQRIEITDNIATELIKCVAAYGEYNKHLPERIIFYRDGVGEGQLNLVFTNELEGIRKLLGSYYHDHGAEMPKLTFIVVTKRINARLFTHDYGNPPPGTIVDNTITFPERYDFYLIAQSVRQGTVSPTSYNVLWDRSGLDPDKIQRLTYKLCHLYYNWSGTVAVPAPCQYAHKLAYLTGLATKTASHARLSHYLHYL